jgi:hypothetical protein
LDEGRLESPACLGPREPIGIARIAAAAGTRSLWLQVEATDICHTRSRSTRADDEGWLVAARAWIRRLWFLDVGPPELAGESVRALGAWLRRNPDAWPVNPETAALKEWLAACLAKTSKELVHLPDGFLATVSGGDEAGASHPATRGQATGECAPRRPSRQPKTRMRNEEHLKQSQIGILAALLSLCFGCAVPEVPPSDPAANAATAFLLACGEWKWDEAGRLYSRNHPGCRQERFGGSNFSTSARPCKATTMMTADLAPQGPAGHRPVEKATRHETKPRGLHVDGGCETDAIACP